MPEISSFVFFDIETTGLPFQENNQTKIIEFSFVAVLRKHLEITPYNQMPPMSKLTFVLNPQKPICREVTKLTGLSRRALSKAPVFKEKVKSIISFLEDLPNPVCLIAHNGNNFDFKILLAECNDAFVSLPPNILCVDSLMGFRRILSNSGINTEPQNTITPTTEHISQINHSNLEHPISTSNVDDLLTDDEDDEWPHLNISTEDWEEIDTLLSPSVSSESEPENINHIHGRKMNTKRSETIKNVFKKDTMSKDKECFKLTAIYKKLMNKDEENAHRAEGDCLMLLQCVIAFKKYFLPWADNNCKLLTDIKPLVRSATSRRYYRTSRFPYWK